MADGLNREAVADELVRTLYGGFDMESLRLVLEVGKKMPVKLAMECDAALFIAALEREIERRGTV